MIQIKKDVNKNSVVYILKNHRQIRIELANATQKQLKMLLDLKHPSVEADVKSDKK